MDKSDLRKLVCCGDCAKWMKLSCPKEKTLRPTIGRVLVCAAFEPRRPLPSGKGDEG